MTEKDKQALELAMKIMGRDRRSGDRTCRNGLMGSVMPTRYRWGIFCQPQPWQEVAEFAAALCQRDALNLTPWEDPPCRAHVDAMGGDGSVKLLAKMEAAGISRWHPDPLRALEQANAN